MTRLRNLLRLSPTLSPGKNTFVKAVGMLPIMRKIGEGKHTTSPRYLQMSPDVHALRETHVKAICARLHSRVPMTDKLVVPVDMVLPRLFNHPNAGYSHACGIQPTALSAARTSDNLGGSSYRVKNDRKGRKMTGLKRQQRVIVLMDISAPSQTSMAKLIFLQE